MSDFIIAAFMVCFCEVSTVFMLKIRDIGWFLEASHLVRKEENDKGEDVHGGEEEDLE